MTGGTRRAAALAVAALTTTFAPIALADFVARVHNESNVEAKGIVQNHQPIMWLKRGQAEEIRIRGKWIRDIRGDFVINFENLGNANIQYCLWKMHVNFPVNSRGEKFTDKDIGGSINVKLDVKLERHEPGFKCEVGGQFLGRVHKESSHGLLKALENVATFPFQPADDQGATLDFYLRNEKK